MITKVAPDVAITTTPKELYRSFLLFFLVGVFFGVVVTAACIGLALAAL